VLANEDALMPGEYPIRLQVVGPGLFRVLERNVTVKIPEPNGKAEAPFATPIFAEDVVVDGPVGRYRFLAAFEKGASAAGGETEFYVADPEDMPAVEGKVALWGRDDALVQWLIQHGIVVGKFDPASPAAGEVLLLSTEPEPPGDEAAFNALKQRIERGATAVCLSPDVFAKDQDANAWLPVKDKCHLGAINGWLYLKDEWAKDHPIFDGLPANCLMDYTYYREIIPNRLWFTSVAPDEAVAGATKASQDYTAGLTVAVYRLGKGRIILNTLRIRGNLGEHPVAERLLRNMLIYAADEH
jgi:hypothetical protein